MSCNDYGKNKKDVLSLTLKHLEEFYHSHPHVHESHGLAHALVVFRHAQHAIDEHDITTTTKHPLSLTEQRDILLAALLHDVDDRKYFPNNSNHKTINDELFVNARQILNLLGEDVISNKSLQRILSMIDWVSCSKHGNSCPAHIQQTGDYHWLIPRWSDRLEAVGKAGIVRCYLYTLEQGQPLSSEASPRPQCVEEVWKFATPERFQAYQDRGGSSQDMISHYYDKLLHVAYPPQDIVQNSYLERMAQDSVKDMLEVCLQFGKTGVVDETFIRNLMDETN